MRLGICGGLWLLWLLLHQLLAEVVLLDYWCVRLLILTSILGLTSCFIIANKTFIDCKVLVLVLHWNHHVLPVVRLRMLLQQYLTRFLQVLASLIVIYLHEKHFVLLGKLSLEGSYISSLLLLVCVELLRCQAVLITFLNHS